MRMLAAAAILFSVAPGLASEPSASGEDTAAEPSSVLIPLGRTRLGHFTVDLHLDRPVLTEQDSASRREIPVVLDTAASHTALRGPVAEQLNDGAPFVLDRVAHSTTGEFLTDTFILANADFGTGPRDILSIVLPGPDNTAPGSEGFLGTSAFDAERVEIDFTRSRLTVDPRLQVAGDLRLDPARGIVVGYATMRGIDQPVRILIDTGSNASVANSVLAGRRTRPDPLQEAVVEGVDGQARLRSERRRLFGGLQVGDLCFPVFWATVLDVHAFDNLGWTDEPAMLIGLDILDDARLRIDYESGAVDIEGVTDTACERAG